MKREESERKKTLKREEAAKKKVQSSSGRCIDAHSDRPGRRKRPDLRRLASRVAGARPRRRRQLLRLRSDAP